jgi:integrative and conjugative element protein (TIGR02256 family)
MKPLRVVLMESAVKEMRAQMRKVLFTETGGPMVGYRKDDTLFVTAAAGPGVGGELRMCSVLIDGESAARFCALAHETSRGRDDYVGDWHCHLSWSIRHSSLDVDAMRQMAEWEFSPTKHPVSVIWSKWRRGYVRAFVYDDGVLRPVKVLRDHA